MDITKKLAAEFSIREKQVADTVALIDEGNTIPFIARYRKEATGGLSDELLRDLNERLEYLRSLEESKEEVIRLIDEQGNSPRSLRRKSRRRKSFRGWRTCISRISRRRRPGHPRRKPEGWSLWP